MARLPGLNTLRPVERVALSASLSEGSRSGRLGKGAERSPGRTHRLRTSILVLMLVLLSACRGESVYPDRPILLVCPWAVGGGTDRLSRQLAAFLEEELDVPVNVINATGGAGVTGHARGAWARPDGYTLTMMTVEINMLHWRGLTELTWEDFEPVVLLNRDPAAVLMRADDERWETLQDLTADVEREPGSLTASGTAAGGIWHLALAGWLSSVGLPADGIRWIPMQGAGPALQELLSGGIDLVSCSLPEARILIESGQVRSLGVMSERRSEQFLDIPSFGGLGVDWEMGAWRGIGVPRGTPAERVERLAAAMERIFQGRVRVGERTFPEFMEMEGFALVWEPPEPFAETLARTDEALGSLLVRPEFASLEEGRFRPMDFPRLLFLGLAISLGAVWAGRFRRSTDDQERARPAPASGARVDFLLLVLGVVFFVLTVEHLGFVATSAALLLVLLLRLGTRPVPALLIVLLMVPAVYQLFANLLRVPLARGLLEW